MKLTVEDILGLSEEEYIMVYDESKEEYFKDILVIILCLS